MVCLLFDGICHGQNEAIVAEGMSALSFSAAVREAQRAAVEQGAGTLIRSQSEIENFQVKKDVILARTQGYITGYDIIEKKQEPGLYTVKIKANVSLDKIRDDMAALDILLERMERPKLMVLIDESHGGLKLDGMRISETEMVSLLQKKGFDIADKEQTARVKKASRTRQALAGNEGAAKALGAGFGAQYIIVGKAAVENAGEALAGTGIHSMQASIQVNIIQTQTGMNLGSVVERGVFAHVSEIAGATRALKMAAQKVVENRLIETIMQSFQDFVNNGRPIQVHVTGIDAFRRYKDVSEFFQSLEPVVSCRKRGWNKSGGVLILDLRFKGTCEELADMVDSKTIGKGRLSVEDFASERLDVRLSQ